MQPGSTSPSSTPRSPTSTPWATPPGPHSMHRRWPRHIVDTHHRYLHAELPLLEALAAKVVTVHGERHPELTDVHRQVAELRADLEPHLMKEERVLFPAIAALADGPAEFPFGSVANPIRVMAHGARPRRRAARRAARRRRWLRRAGRRLRQLPRAVRTARGARSWTRTSTSTRRTTSCSRPRFAWRSRQGPTSDVNTVGVCAPTPHRRPSCWRTLGRAAPPPPYARVDGVGAAAGRRRAADRSGDHDPPPDRGRAGGARGRPRRRRRGGRARRGHPARSGMRSTPG